MISVLAYSACIQTPRPDMQMPHVVDVREVASYSTVSLSASFDHTQNLKTAGFLLWKEAGEKRRKEAILGSGSTISVEYNGLDPEEEYQFAVFFGNGQEESLSETYSFSTSALPMPEMAELSVEPAIREARFYIRFQDEAFLVRCTLSFWPDGSETRQQIVFEPVEGVIDYLLSDLSPDTAYQYSVSYTNGRQTEETETASFRTLPVPFSIDIHTDVSPSYASALLGADLTVSGGELSSCGFSYWESGSQNRTQVSVSPVGNRIEYELTGLEPETEYQFSVWYVHGTERGESEPETFRTLPAPQPVPVTQFDPYLLKYLLENFDTDGDGVMTDVELAEIRKVTLSGLPLLSQDGLETLVNLEWLEMGNNTLSRIDVTANKKLQFLSAGDRYLEEIILDNPDLFQTYFCGADIKTLDVSRCPELYICEWYDIPLESVDFSNNWNLYALRFSGTHLKELDLSTNRKLGHLNSVNNADLQVIWLWEGIKLESLEVDPHTQIKYK